MLSKRAQLCRHHRAPVCCGDHRSCTLTRGQHQQAPLQQRQYDEPLCDGATGGHTKEHATGLTPPPTPASHVTYCCSEFTTSVNSSARSSNRSINACNMYDAATRTISGQRHSRGRGRQRWTADILLVFRPLKTRTHTATRPCTRAPHPNTSRHSGI